MKWTVVFAIIAVILSACQRPMTWDDMHGWRPHEYRVPQTLPFTVPVRIQPLVKMRDC
jgi:hypothetical protein